MNRTIISKLNGYRFVEEGVVVSNPSFNHLNFDSSYYLSQIKEWESKVGYVQIAQHSDPLHLMVMANVGSSVEVRIYNCYGERVLDSPIPYMMSNPVGAPNVAMFQSNMTYFSYYSNDILSMLSSGVYHIVLRVTYPTNDVVEFYSEPIHIKDKHIGSYFISYKNRYNKDHVLFEQTGKSFNIRVPCDLNIVLGSDKTVYQDQNMNSFLLSGTAIRNWELTIGGNGKYIPDYVLDILNHVFHVDTIIIDGVHYSVTDKSDLTVDVVNKYPLTSAKIILSEKTVLNERNFTGGGTLPTNPLPPFILAPPISTTPTIRVQPELGVGTDITDVIGGGYTTETANEDGSYLAYLNSILQSQTALQGNFTFVSAGLQYNPAGRDEVTNGSAVVINDAFNFVINGASGSKIANWTTKLKGDGNFAATENFENPFVNDKYSGSYDKSFKHDFELDGSSLYLWVGSGTDSFEIRDMSVSDGYISMGNSFKDMGVPLRDFKIIDSDIVFNEEIFRILKESKGTLESISFSGVGVLGIGALYNTFEKLSYIDVSNNEIDEVEAGKLIKDIYDNVINTYRQTGSYILNGTIDLRGNNILELTEFDKKYVRALEDVYGWSVFLYDESFIDLGFVESDNVCIDDINICGNYKNYGLCFHTSAELVNFLNINFNEDTGADGSFYLNNTNHIVYKNNLSSCGVGFINTRKAGYEIFETEKSTGSNNTIGFEPFISELEGLFFSNKKESFYDWDNDDPKPLILTYNTNLYTDAIIELSGVGSDPKDIIVRDSFGIVVKALVGNTDGTILISDLPAGIYDVEVSMEETGRMDFSTGAPGRVRETLVELKQWGDVVWGNQLSDLFRESAKLIITASDLMKMETVGVTNNFMARAFYGIAGITNIGWVEALPFYTMTNINFLFNLTNGIIDVVLDFNNASHLSNVNAMFNQGEFESIIINNMGSTLAAAGNIIGNNVPNLHTLIYNDLQLSQNITGFRNGTAQAYVDFFDSIGDRTGKDQRTITMRSQDWNKLDTGQKDYVNQLLIDKNWAIAN